MAALELSCCLTRSRCLSLNAVEITIYHCMEHSEDGHFQHPLVHVTIKYTQTTGSMVNKPELLLQLQIYLYPGIILISTSYVCFLPPFPILSFVSAEQSAGRSGRRNCRQKLWSVVQHLPFYKALINVAGKQPPASSAHYKQIHSKLRSKFEELRNFTSDSRNI